MIQIMEMEPATKVHVLIPAAGRGVRFGSGENKIFAPLMGQAVIAHSVARFTRGGVADTVTVIGRPDEIDRLKQVCGAASFVSPAVIAGGGTRQESVRLGLASLDAQSGDTVLVHDGARPLVPQSVIERCIAHGSGQSGAIAAFPVTDTVKRASSDGLISETLDRLGLHAAQTPQAATYGCLLHAFEVASADGFAGTDEASLLEHSGHAPLLVMGARENIKITTADDLRFAEHWLLAERNNRRSMTALRIGNGYDIHRLVPGRRLILGGVEIPSEFGLLGHSDADVLLHAVCDAVLGAAALPDIGHLFPNTDPAYEGASSVALLREVVRRIGELGYVIGNIDCCVIAEQPKIAPYASQMRAILAEATNTDVEQVSIKATTNEGIGSLGAGEGIACHATATIVRE